MKFPKYHVDSDLRSPIIVPSVLTNTGDTNNNIMYGCEQNLVGLLQPGDVLAWIFGVAATNTANNKTFSWYISDQPDALVNEVLIGQSIVTSSAINTIQIDKLFSVVSLTSQNRILGTGTTTNTGFSMGSVAIDFTSGEKYFVQTGQLQLGTEIMKTQFGVSTIYRS